MDTVTIKKYPARRFFWGRPSNLSQRPHIWTERSLAMPECPASKFLRNNKFSWFFSILSSATLISKTQNLHVASWFDPAHEFLRKNEWNLSKRMFYWANKPLDWCKYNIFLTTWFRYSFMGHQTVQSWVFCFLSSAWRMAFISAGLGVVELRRWRDQL